MGKKRRILRRSKFAALRKHSKFRGLVKANLVQKDEPKEVVEPVLLEKTTEPPKLPEAEIIPPPVLLVEKPEPTPEPKPEPTLKRTDTKVSAKKAPSAKKPRTRRSSKKKTATQSTR